MTDVLLRQTPDGGEVTIENGQPFMTDGIETAVFLSLFGGNEQDSGSDGDKPLMWWGNWSEPDPARWYRSETQFLLRSIPAVPANIKRIEDAVGRDLAWMTEGGLATFVGVNVRLPALNTIRIEISVQVDGRLFPVTFEMPWQRSSQ